MAADDSNEPKQHSRRPPHSLKESLVERPRYTTEQLFGTADVVVILHGTNEYLLRRTRNGRLLLTK